MNEFTEEISNEKTRNSWKEIQKELAELKGLISKLLELQEFDHTIKYGYLDKPLFGSTHEKQN